MRVFVQNLGCKVNLYEAQAIKNSFESAGYKIVDINDNADIFVLNTCTVTNKSDSKSRQMISKFKAKNKDSVVVVCGCYSQINPQEVLNLEDVDIVVGTQFRTRIVEYVEKFIKDGIRMNYVKSIEDADYEELMFNSGFDKTRAFIKIEDGCNNFCSYCIIPYARGRVRSRKKESIISEINDLALKGYKEFVLSGIQISDYEDSNTKLIDLIEDISAISNVKRIRLGSIQPKLINEENAKRLSQIEKLCHHYHLSLQSGSDKILRAMNRKYTIQEYKTTVENLKKHIRDISLTTDIIVGFPGESNEDFQESIKIVREIGFLKVHVFRYSKRKGTKAYNMQDQVDEHIKQRRAEILSYEEKNSAKNFLKDCIYKEFDVLFESYDEKEKKYSGYSGNYIKCYISSDHDIRNEIINVKALSLFKEGLNVERMV